MDKEFEAQVRAEINGQNPNEPEELDDRAVEATAYYIYYGLDTVPGDLDNVYAMYDMFKFVFAAGI